MNDVLVSHSRNQELPEREWLKDAKNVEGSLSGLHAGMVSGRALNRYCGKSGSGKPSLIVESPANKNQEKRNPSFWPAIKFRIFAERVAVLNAGNPDPSGFLRRIILLGVLGIREGILAGLETTG